MKDKTYIIPAIDFYVLIPENTLGTPDEICNNVSNGRYKVMIPFEKVDGLLLGELMEIPLFADGFVISAINHIDIKENDTDYKIKSTYANFFIQNKSDIPKIALDKTIDKVIEESYESVYTKVNERKRQIFNSFFQKYQDGSYKKTKERVKRLLSNR